MQMCNIGRKNLPLFEFKQSQTRQKWFDKINYRIVVQQMFLLLGFNLRSIYQTKNKNKNQIFELKIEYFNRIQDLTTKFRNKKKNEKTHVEIFRNKKNGH